MVFVNNKDLTPCLVPGAAKPYRKKVMRLLTGMILIGIVLMSIAQICVVGDIYAMGSTKQVPFDYARIRRNAIAMPVGRIFLVRADSSYCAVMFTKSEMSKSEENFFSAYESWFQEDGTGDFSKPNVGFTKDDLWWKLPIGFGRLELIRRFHDEIQCGPVILKWEFLTGVSMTPKKTMKEDQTVLFAPTPWTSISQVNIDDPRITWYPPGNPDYDAPNVVVPIDQLWK